MVTTAASPNSSGTGAAGTAVTKAFVPLQFAPGEAHQFDWSEEHLVIGGVWRKLIVAHLKLCYSKAFVVQAYRRKAMKCCLTPMPARLPPWAVYRVGASTTT